VTRPDYLKKGDKIGITSTARKVTVEEMQPCIDVLKNWGLEVVISQQLYESQDQFAGSDEIRTSELQEMLDDSSIKAILFARGGYGTVRLVDQLDFNLFCQNPKWLIGYSDITVIHSHVNTLYEIQTLHGPMAINFIDGGESIDALQQVLFGSPGTFKMKHHDLNRAGEGQGILIGGNLSLLYSMKGSISDVETSGRILFIEDLDEYLYHIDRMMMSLKRSGMLSNLSGLIVGGMTEMNDNDVPFGKTAEEIIAETVSEFDYPLCFNFLAGHIKENMPLVFGAKGHLTVEDTDSNLIYL